VTDIEDRQCRRHWKTVPLVGDECAACEAVRLFEIRVPGKPCRRHDLAEFFEAWMQDECCDESAAAVWLDRLKRDPAEVVRMWLHDELPPNVRAACFDVSRGSA